MYDLHDVQLPIDSGTVGEFVFKDNAKVFLPSILAPLPPSTSTSPKGVFRSSDELSHFREYILTLATEYTPTTLP